MHLKGTGSKGLQIRVHGALTGFKNMNKEWKRQMHTEWGVKYEAGAKPGTDTTLTVALAKHAFPSISAEELKNAVANIGR